ncbi:MAG: FAD-binding oxidoreductase [Gammaproteobacteria bacterium]
MTEQHDSLDTLATIPHTGVLEDLTATPGFLLPASALRQSHLGWYSCSFCGVGDCGHVLRSESAPAAISASGSGVVLRVTTDGSVKELKAVYSADGRLKVNTESPLTPPGGIINGELAIDSKTVPIAARESKREYTSTGQIASQEFVLLHSAMSVTETRVTETVPTAGCVKLNLSLGRQRPAFPIHTAPSLLDGASGRRRNIRYREAIAQFADLLLQHRRGQGRILLYACGQIDYFTIFAMQEVFRLLGVRNLTGNAEHCLNAGAVHNEILTGQEGPFVTIAQAVEGPNRFYLCNGWNGFISHPPVFRALLKREDLDAYLIEVMETESAGALMQRLGPDRVLLIRSRSDPHLALAVANEILHRYPGAVDHRFVSHFSDRESFRKFSVLAASERFDPVRVAARIAPESELAVRLVKGIRSIAHKLASPPVVPINIPSVGLSQTSGVVAHCLWGSTLALLGKYGLRPEGTLAGGTLRLPGQINAESEVQGLSRKYFMGRIPIEMAAEAALRMGLPEDAYQAVLADAPRAALDYSDSADVPELFVCFGTQFEANMMGRRRWLNKLADPKNRLVVIDPIPDPYTLAHAELIIPSPPHSATTKLYQNGEWKLSLSMPQKRASAETRSDATIIYDTMAAIGERLETDRALAQAHPDLARYVASGYVRSRFGCLPEPETDAAGDGDGLARIDGEVSRPQLWARIQAYMSGGSGPLYCAPEHADGTPIAWQELLDRGSVIYGGVGHTRFVLDYDRADAHPFRDVFRRPQGFRFFAPTEDDLAIPEGIIMNSGRSCLSDDRARVRFAIATFNSGKATPLVDMPDENPLYVSQRLAKRHNLEDGDWVEVRNRENGERIDLPVVVTGRLKGELCYVSFHKSRAQIDSSRYINDVTSHLPRCPYTAQTQVKATLVSLERSPSPKSAVAQTIAARALDTTRIDPRIDLPIWEGQATPLYVTDIIRETHDVYTFRFQGDPLCRFVYWPGQFCTLVLNINGNKVVRSYTISSTPTRPFALEVTIKRVADGLVSNWLIDQLKVGDQVEISGPKGKFCLAPGHVPPKLLFLGAGSGVTPLMSMTRWLADVSAQVDVRFFNSVRTPEDLIFRHEIELITSRYRQFTPLIVTTTQGKASNWTGIRGRISRAMLEMAVPDLHERHVYLCGPDGFMASAKGILMEMGFDLARLHAESFGGLRTSIANKTLPARAATAQVHASAFPENAIAPATAAIRVEFARSGKVVSTNGQITVLELAEANDIDLDYGCRVGSCRDCKCRLLQGAVDMPEDTCLIPGERGDGYILACVARPKGHCTVDA